MRFNPFLTRRQFNGASLAAMGLSLFGLSSCKSKKKEGFRIGVLSPKTGVDSYVGLGCEQGARTAALFLKDSFPEIEILYVDTESSVDQGRTKAERLISQGVDLLVGAHNSAVTFAIAQVCEQRHVPLIINIAAAPKIMEQGYQYVFRNFPTSEMLAHQGVKLMKDLFDLKQTYPKTAAILYTNDTYGQAMHSSVLKTFSLYNLPFQVVEAVCYDPRTQDLSAEIGRIKSSHAELLIPITRLNDAILMIKECVKQRYQPMGIISPASPGMYEKQFHHILGSYADYCITNTAWYNPKSPLACKMLEIFQRLYPESHFDLNVAFTCEAVWLAADVYRRSCLKGQSLIQTLQNTYLEERVVYGGPLTFDPKGQGVNIGSVCLQNHQGKSKIILPSSLQEIPPVFPVPSWKMAW